MSEIYITKNIFPGAESQYGREFEKNWCCGKWFCKHVFIMCSTGRWVFFEVEHSPGIVFRGSPPFTLFAHHWLYWIKTDTRSVCPNYTRSWPCFKVSDCCIDYTVCAYLWRNLKKKKKVHLVRQWVHDIQYLLTFSLLISALWSINYIPENSNLSCFASAFIKGSEYYRILF